MFNILTRFLIFMTVLGILIFPSDIISQGQNAVELAFFRVIPSLFPFFVLSSLIISLGISTEISKFFGFFLNKIFKTSNCSPYILGIIGGYPIGFKSVVELYSQKNISKKQAEDMICFCNNAGPAFIIGFVGVFLFNNKNIGYILLSGHLISSIILGLIFSKKHTTQEISHKKIYNEPFYEVFIKSVNSSFSSILTVCGYIIFFSVFAEILMKFHVFKTIAFIFSPVLSYLNISDNEFISILIGMIEMTSGINYLSQTQAHIVSKIIISSFLLAFSGLSIHFQTLNFNTDLNLSKYYIARILHSIFSPIISIILYSLL